MSGTQKTITRRNLLASTAIPSAATLLIPAAAWGGISTTPREMRLPVLRQPDLVLAFVGDVKPEGCKLSQAGNRWTGTGFAASVRVNIQPDANKSAVSLESPTLPVQRIQLRWKFQLPGDVLALGDAWERSYGDLEWRPLQAERAMPWYAMLHAQEQNAGMGVKTGAAAFAFWQVDSAGISLWLDVRNGGNGVSLGDRTLELATIVTCTGAPGEGAFTTTKRLCRLMAEGTRVPGRRGESSLDVIYGSNDWYYAYGNNTHEGILRDGDLVKSLAPAGADKPFTVIDDGYQDRSRFPSLPKLAAEIRSRGWFQASGFGRCRLQPRRPATCCCLKGELKTAMRLRPTIRPSRRGLRLWPPSRPRPADGALT